MAERTKHNTANRTARQAHTVDDSEPAARDTACAVRLSVSAWAVCGATVYLRRVSSSLHPHSDVDHLEAVGSQHEQRLEHLQSQQVGLHELDGLPVHFDETAAALAVRHRHAGLLATEHLHAVNHRGRPTDERLAGWLVGSVERRRRRTRRHGMDGSNQTSEETMCDWTALNGYSATADGVHTRVGAMGGSCVRGSRSSVSGSLMAC